MNIGSISSSMSSQLIQHAEARETKGAPDNDGDTDDAGKALKAAPTVNANGQSVGQVIHEIA